MMHDFLFIVIGIDIGIVICTVLNICLNRGLR